MMPWLRSCLVVSLLVVWLQGEAAAFKRTASPSLLITRPDKFNAPQPEQVHAQSSLPSAASHGSTTLVNITMDFVASLSLVAVMMFSTPDSICPHQLPGPLAPPVAPFFHTTAAAANLPESTGASTKNIGSPAALVPVVKLQRALAAVDPDGDLGLIQRQLAALPADEKKIQTGVRCLQRGHLLQAAVPGQERVPGVLHGRVRRPRARVHRGGDRGGGAAESAVRRAQRRVGGRGRGAGGGCLPGGAPGPGGGPGGPPGGGGGGAEGAGRVPGVGPAGPARRVSGAGGTGTITQEHKTQGGSMEEGGGVLCWQRRNTRVPGGRWRQRQRWPRLLDEDGG
mmetsp:Transcript_21665/g.34726  ORF Transcript_21665/g.34726 Transcript_21665/m.34726 type:complete len:339 (-) Transcript_21665:179-1195(-)